MVEAEYTSTRVSGPYVIVSGVGDAEYICTRISGPYVIVSGVIEAEYTSVCENFDAEYTSTGILYGFRKFRCRIVILNMIQ